MNASCAAMPAVEKVRDRVALLCVVSHCAQQPFSAASSAAATDAAWSAG